MARGCIHLLPDGRPCRAWPLRDGRPAASGTPLTGRRRPPRPAGSAVSDGDASGRSRAPMTSMGSRACDHPAPPRDRHGRRPRAGQLHRPVPGPHRGRARRREAARTGGDRGTARAPGGRLGTAWHADPHLPVRPTSPERRPAHDDRPTTGPPGGRAATQGRHAAVAGGGPAARLAPRLLRLARGPTPRRGPAGAPPRPGPHRGPAAACAANRSSDGTRPRSRPTGTWPSSSRS